MRTSARTSPQEAVIVNADREMYGLRGYSVAEIALILGADADDVARAVDEALRGSQMPMGPDGEARVYPWDLHRVWATLQRRASD